MLTISTVNRGQKELLQIFILKKVLNTFCNKKVVNARGSKMKTIELVKNIPTIIRFIFINYNPNNNFASLIKGSR